MRWKTTAFTWHDTADEFELRAATSRSFVARLRAPHTAQLTMNGLHPQAAQLVELVTDIRISCDAEDGLGYQPCFLGRTGNTQDTLSEDVHSVAFQFYDYKWIMNRHTHWSDGSAASADVNTNVWGRINADQNVSHGGMGITAPAGTLGINREHSWKDGDSIFKTVDAMANRSPTFDWDINPGTKQLQTWVKRGQDVGETLEYGMTVSALTRARVVSDFANYIRVKGGPGTTDTAVSFGPGLVPGNIGLEPRGRFERTFQHTDVSIQATLHEHSAAYLARSLKLGGAYNVTLKKGWWRGPAHLWLGDTVTFKLKHGRANESQSMRVFEISIDIETDTVRMVLVA